MNTHDYLLLIDAQERYAELLKTAEQERRLHSLGDPQPASTSLWDWFQHWFQHRYPAFGLTKP
jgi:hypothetical protein